jgi:hypothetical protein
VRYTFDEGVEEVLSPALFHVVSRDGLERYDGTDVTGDTDGDAVVDVFFLGESAGGVAGAPDSQAEADELTVATVDFGAVQDPDNEDNPEGDAALGDDAGGGTTLPAGVTSAPDLVSVDVQNEIGTDDEVYETVFTFDETVRAVPIPTGFFLILEDGTEIPCTVTDTTFDDATLEAECGTAGGGDEFVPGDVSRGWVEEDSVSDAAAGGNFNPLQAAEAEGDDGNTEIPDLVSAQFFPGSTSTAQDRVAYTFDEPIDDGAAIVDANFNIYYTDGTQIDGANCTRDSARVVVCEFGTTGLEDAVGASVDEGAVVEDVAAGVARPNEEDEVGVQNTGATTGAGFTEGPDLIEVNVEYDTTVTGTRQGITATYTFDDDIDDASVVDPTLFILYDVDGNRYEAETCEATDDTDPGEEATVECTDYFDTDGATSLDDDDEEDLVEDATLGTVDDGAVFDEDDGIDNPEGAEPVTAA